MAVEVEAAGQVDEFIRILRRRIWWIIIPFVVLGSLGTFFAVVVPKKYVVSTKIMVRDVGEQAGPLGQNASANEGQVAKINILSRSRIDSVLKNMRLKEYQQLSDSEQKEYCDDVIGDLRVSIPTMPRDSNQQLVEVSYQHTRAEEGLDFLNRLKDSWTSEVLQRHQARVATELAKTKDKLADLVKQRQQVNEDLRKLRTEFKIAPPSPTAMVSGVDRPASFDLQTALGRAIDELTDVINELDLELEREEARWAAMPPTIDNVIVGPITRVDERLAKIDDDIAVKKDTIRINGWSPSHSNRMILEKQIRDLQDLKVEISQETQRITLDETEVVENKDRTQLRSTIDEKIFLRDQKVRERSAKRTRLELLDQENEQLQDALGRVALLQNDEEAFNVTIEQLRIQKSKLDIQVQKLSSPEGNPFEILEKPILPTKPTAPNPWIIAIGSVLFGLALGFGLAILKEYSKSCFRSARELNRVMTHPVLGTVNAIRTRRERARSFLVRSVLGGGSLLFVISVGYVTWAYAENQTALTEPLVNAIDDFREMLR